jgi:hypothetical protein
LPVLVLKTTDISATVFAIDLKVTQLHGFEKLAPKIGETLFVVRPEDDIGVMQLSLLDRKVNWSGMTAEPGEGRDRPCP